MRCGADRGARGAAPRPLHSVVPPAIGGRSRRPGWLTSAAACLATACLVAGCSGGRPAGGAGGRGGHGPAALHGFAGGGVAVAIGNGGGGGVVVAIGGGGGGFLVVPGVAGSQGRPQITVPPVPPAGSGRPINLPLSTYADVAGLQQSALSDANALLTQKCMAGRGFSYAAQTSSSEEQSIVQSTEYGYGVGGLAEAASYGYGQPNTGGGSQGGPAFLGGFASFGDLAKQPPAWTLALLGFAPGVRLGRNQAPGCLQQAGSLLYGRGSGLSDPVPQIAIQASQWTQTDPRVLAVEAAWARCMAARGYDKYRTPQQAAYANWPKNPTAKETATAVADITCKRQVNLINTWLTVESAYQQVLIGRDLATLSQLQANFAKILRRAEQLLALPALPSGRGRGAIGGQAGWSISYSTG